MRTVNLKTLFAGKAWLRDKHLEWLEQGDSIKLKWKGEEMMVTPEDLPTLRKTKSDRTFKSRFENNEYYLWGIWWKPENREPKVVKQEKKSTEKVDKQASLFSS